MKASKLLTLGILGGSSSFSPLSIPGLALWLDASDASTLFQDDAGTTPATADNAVVGYWADKSGNGKHVTQAAAGSKPVLKLTGFNSKRGILFDGDDGLGLTGLVMTSFTIFTAYQAAEVSFGLHYYLGGLGQGCYAGGTVGGFNGYGVTADSQLREASEEPTTAGIVTTQNAALFRNGAEATYGKTDTLTGLTVTRIGLRGDDQLGLIGYISEVLIYAATLTAGQRQSVETYLNAKWAVY